MNVLHHFTEDVGEEADPKELKDDDEDALWEEGREDVPEPNGCESRKVEVDRGNHGCCFVVVVQIIV